MRYVLYEVRVHDINILIYYINIYEYIYEYDICTAYIPV